MIIYKTPYRIPLAGGGTDIDFYYRKRGGKLISFTFDQYIYTFLSRRPLDEKILVQTTRSEFSESLSKVKHNTIKEVLKYFKINKKVQIGTFSTIPTKSGLGTYKQCPYKYKLEKIQRTPTAGSTISFDLGNSVHNTIDALVKYKDGEIPTKEELHAKLEEEWIFQSFPSKAT